MQRVDQCGHDAGAAGAQRVADGNGAAVDVGLGQIRAGVGSLGVGDGGHAVAHPGDAVSRFVG
jgi:hypothetical protein